MTLGRKKLQVFKAGLMGEPIKPLSSVYQLCRPHKGIDCLRMTFQYFTFLLNAFSKQVKKQWEQYF